MQETYLDTPLIDCRCAHGEGPVWDRYNERLLWVDLTAGNLHSCDHSGGRHAILSFDEPLCAITPVADNRAIAAFAKRLVMLNSQTGELLQTLTAIETDLPDNRCNDGKMDPHGRFWIGTMSADGSRAGAGSLYCFERGALRTVLDGLTIANGMDWSRNEQCMYFIDTPSREIWCFDYDRKSGSISNRKTVVTVPESLGWPDGMCLAPDGSLWVAHWGAGCVCRWDAQTGALLEKVNTGCPHTSSCCVGPRGTLYITTSKLGLDALTLKKAPFSGSMFVHNLNPS
jgi:sugar lactone lactonase YvrE